jgi:hypothetical protein
LFTNLGSELWYWVLGLWSWKGGAFRRQFLISAHLRDWGEVGTSWVMRGEDLQLGSNRGGIPEAIGQGGFVYDIPACYTPQTQTVPTAEEVETIIRLWDDAAFNERQLVGRKQTDLITKTVCWPGVPVFGTKSHAMSWFT